MTRDELLARLRELRENPCPEDAHIEADRALLEFIADDGVVEAFNEVTRWYS